MELHSMVHVDAHDGIAALQLLALLSRSSHTSIWRGADDRLDVVGKRLSCVLADHLVSISADPRWHRSEVGRKMSRTCVAPVVLLLEAFLLKVEQLEVPSLQSHELGMRADLCDSL